MNALRSNCKSKYKTVEEEIEARHEIFHKFRVSLNKIAWKSQDTLLGLYTYVRYAIYGLRLFELPCKI